MQSLRAAALVAAVWAARLQRTTADAREACLEEAHQLLFLHEAPLRPHGTDAGMVKERALDYCALKASADKKYFCSYFGEFVKDAYAHVSKNAPVTPATFCAITEDHAQRMATQIEGVQPLRLGEVVSDETCVADVGNAMSPDTSVTKDHVPDFWYLFCIHQHDCEHAIPARNKWCHTSHIPRLSAKTCELLREDAVDLITVKPQDAYSAENLCGWFTGFIGHQAARLEAYEYVVFGKTSDPSLIPVPGTPEHALMESRLTNGAKSHWIRDHSAHPVTYSHAAPLAVAAALFLTA